MVLDSAATCWLARTASLKAMLSTTRGTVSQITTTATMMAIGTGRTSRQAMLSKRAIHPGRRSEGEVACAMAGLCGGRFDAGTPGSCRTWVREWLTGSGLRDFRSIRGYALSHGGQRGPVR